MPTYDDLDDNFKACGFCAQPTHETFKFSDVLLDFLEYYLDVKGSSLPTRVCSVCYKGTKDAKLFKDKIIKSFTKLKTNGISSSLIWGRSSEERSWLKKKFNGLANGEGDYYGKFSPALTYDPEKYHLVLPLVSISPAEKALADAKVVMSSSGRVIKKKVKSYVDDDDRWDGDDWSGFSNNVKAEPTIPKKTEAEWDAELSDCGETFPAKGPYQCEICQNITKMKKDFVAHIKEKHMKMIDNKVLKTLDQDLEKRRKKICEKMGVKYVPPKRTYNTKKKAAAKPKKKKNDDTSDTDDDVDEFIPSKKRPKRTPVQQRGIDAEGNTLPMPGAAGKNPADCPICGKNISRLNEMGKHQESFACMKVRKEKGIVAKEQGPSYKEVEEDSKGDKKVEEKEDPGDWDDDYDAKDAKDDSVDDAIQEAVKASLETAAKDDAIQQAVKASLETAAKELKEPSNGHVDTLGGDYASLQTPVHQQEPSMPQWDGSQVTMETVVSSDHGSTGGATLSRPWGGPGQQETNSATASITHSNGGGVWSQFQSGYYHPQP